jgi:hypothetical protein
MNEIVASLMLDLVEWLERSPRTYAEAIEAWRTSCPRLTVWEDAVDGGLIAIATEADGVMRVRATEYGRHRLRQRLITGANGGDAASGMATGAPRP